jgi:predicted methyltransferase
MKFLLLTAVATIALASAAMATDAVDPALMKAVQNPSRSANFVARDKYRHPVEELTFLGLRPDATVMEIWPGGGYWSEILAPYLHDHGTYYTPVEAGEGWAKYSKTFRDKVAADPATYGSAHLTEMGKGSDDIAPPNSVDLVLDTRNFHNWMDIGDVPEMLADIKRVLKPGGILVIEDHRALDSVPQDPKAENGYVRQDFVIDAAKKSGFELVEASELLANPKDTKNWPQGVWTLPPTFALGDKDRAKYAAIGEADNMLLKFRKPAS